MPADDRELLMAHDALVCSRCGNLRAECEDPAIDWHPRTAVCYATASTEWARRRLHKDHPAEKVDQSGAHYLDGRWTWVSQVAPDKATDEFA